MTYHNTTQFFIDAGVEFIRFRERTATAGTGTCNDKDITLRNTSDINGLFREGGISDILSRPDRAECPVYITGKMADTVRSVIRMGETVLTSASLWAAARSLIKKHDNGPLAVMELSASGYNVLSITENGRLYRNNLVVNPKCGAGSGVNINRILQKLAIDPDEVDTILADYTGEAGAEKRKKIPVRADRCGVFSSSATISDKNQGVPLDHALAVTMKSEVMKPCLRLPEGVATVYLTGGVFRWSFARDCAGDYLREKGVSAIFYDNDQTLPVEGMIALSSELGGEFRNEMKDSLREGDIPVELPSFSSIKKEYIGKGMFLRHMTPDVSTPGPDTLKNTPVNMALDIGSTMAKLVLSHAESGDILMTGSYDNHGDTVMTVRHIFMDLKSRGLGTLRVQNIGLTGSGRYQVQKVLQALYPHLEERIHVLVENYAHARGSIHYARERIDQLASDGITDINRDFCLLVDIGGEDTKISVISLAKNELFDNAMNIKCSAGTGSLMDTLKALFSMAGIEEAYEMALNADKAYQINATCAVFLMENARSMQAAGHPRDHILASCVYAIVENMARSLWGQVRIPENAVVLLHGQTMLSDPLPLATTARLQSHTMSNLYAVVPPFPGHRACAGLLHSIEEKNIPLTENTCDLDVLINFNYSKRLFVCHGRACGDYNARCSRTTLSWQDKGETRRVSLGGCTTVNEQEGGRRIARKNETPDSYREIWDLIDSHMPRSDSENRLVIPRCFVMSEKAFFLATVLRELGFPVHVDNVRKEDVIAGQPLFPIDSCAPNIGAAGHFLRLAGSEQGIILVPQIDFLASEGSLGRTCTTNQGGPLIAIHFAQRSCPEARFHVFELSLADNDPRRIARQIHDYIQPVFSFYGIDADIEKCRVAVESALMAQEALHETISNRLADYIEGAMADERNVTLVMGREYILNPGIYDSHIGRLLRDRDAVALPGYAFDCAMDERYGYFYWKNPHDIVSKIQAVTRRQLHVLVKHGRLKETLRRIESGSTGSRVSVVTVSTFRCGPDSVTLPMINHIAREYPSLLIQSDAMIAELAHLENRVNTHMNQLEKELHADLSGGETESFDVKILDRYFLDSLNPATDVIYFPTLDDNRIITSVFRAMGMVVFDNYDDSTYSLEGKARQGRRHMGDAVCIPMAAVHADMMNSIEDFKKRKRDKDPAVLNKTRIVLFMHGGDGPCRLGQYVHMYKMSFHKLFGHSSENEHPVRIMENISSSLLGVDDVTADLDRWVGVQAYQAIIMQGVFHAAFLRAVSLCTNRDEFDRMFNDYLKLKQKTFSIIENDVKPGPVKQKIMALAAKHTPALSGVAQYFCLGLYNNNGYRRILRDFARKWITGREKISGRKKISVHIDGELYMRIAQMQEIVKALIDNLGFGGFTVTYSPIWIFFENILEARIITATREIEKLESMEETVESIKLIMERKNIMKETEGTISNLRNILAGPLYKAAGIPCPHPMKDIFRAAEPVVPTFKPYGELVPYTGETILKLREGCDLVLNVAPEGCMVSSMGQLLSPKIITEGGNPDAAVQNLFSLDGEINEEILRLALLKIMGPEGYYHR